jgi:hypothetical protein
VGKASAERASNYGFEPELGIKSAKLNADGFSVTVETSTAPKLGDKYALTVLNIRDSSPAANAIKSPEKIAFTMTPPVFDLKFMSKDASISFGTVPADRPFSLKGRPKIVSGKFGPALRLSGDGECLIVNDFPELNPTSAITVSAWIRADDWDGNRRIIQKGDGDNQYRLLKEEDKLVFDIAGVGAVSGPLPSAGDWHNVAASYDGAVMRLYVDGRQVGEVKASGEIGVTPDPFYIGAKNTSSVKGDYFQGYMDKITIWDYALSPDHIATLSKTGGGNK